ncbi:antitoxin VapB family protein [Candidatus Pyrohabitans sp.]
MLSVYFRIWGTKTISLSDEACRLLKEAKRPGEGLSDVVKRMVRKRSLSSFAGLWSE